MLTAEVSLEAPSRESLEATWRSWVEEFGPALRRVASTYEFDEAHQEDLFQEICLALWRAVAGFRGQASARTYVFRIAHNRGLTHGWRRSRKQSESIEVAERVEDPSPGPEARFGQLQDRARLVAAIRDLPPGQRQVLVLSLEGLSHREIGEVMGLKENNVSVRLHRARKSLAQQVGIEEKSS